MKLIEELEKSYWVGSSHQEPGIEERLNIIFKTVIEILRELQKESSNDGR